VPNGEGRRGWVRGARQQLDGQRAERSRAVPRSRAQRLREGQRLLEEEHRVLLEANAAAACLYCGIWYVESRVSGGIEAHPPFVFVPAALMYDGPVAQEMYFQASVGSGELFGIASAQLHNQPEAFVFSTGAKA